MNTWNQKNRIIFCIFRGDSGIVKKTNSELTYPRVTLGSKKNWGTYFFLKNRCTKFCENPCSSSGDIYMFISDRQTNIQTDRLTDECLTTIYGRVKLFFYLKKLPPLLTTQITLRSFALFVGG